MKMKFFLQGVLRVHIVQAIKLLKKDVSMLGRGKSDPYVIVTMGAQEFRSKTIDNTVNPKWDYWCEVIILLLSHIILYSSERTKSIFLQEIL